MFSYIKKITLLLILFILLFSSITFATSSTEAIKLIEKNHEYYEYTNMVCYPYDDMPTITKIKWFISNCLPYFIFVVGITLILLGTIFIFKKKIVLGFILIYIPIIVYIISYIFYIFHIS